MPHHPCCLLVHHQHSSLQLIIHKDCDGLIDILNTKYYSVFNMCTLNWIVTEEIPEGWMLGHLPTWIFPFEVYRSEIHTYNTIRLHSSSCKPISCLINLIVKLTEHCIMQCNLHWSVLLKHLKGEKHVHWAMWTCYWRWYDAELSTLRTFPKFHRKE